MDMLNLISDKAEIILSAIGVIISAAALIQGSVRKNNGKNPVIAYIVAVISILFVLFIVASTFLYPTTDDTYGPAQTQTQTDPSGGVSDPSDDVMDTQPENSTKRIVLTSCTIDQGRIDGTYDFVGAGVDVLVYRGDLYSINGESHWVNISDKKSFSYDSNAQTFTFVVNEVLPDGKYAIEFCCIAQKETFTIEVLFEVKDACYYGKSCYESYSDGISSIFTGTKDLFDGGL